MTNDKASSEMTNSKWQNLLRTVHMSTLVVVGVFCVVHLLGILCICIFLCTCQTPKLVALLEVLRHVLTYL